MTINIAGIGIVISKIVLVDEAIAHAIAVGIGTEEGVVKVDASIDDD